MARPIWTGTLSFGLLNVPVALMSGERRVDLHFRMLDARDKRPIRFERVNADTGEEVPWKDIVKAFEYSKGNYVVVGQQDIASAAPESHETVEVEAFVDAADIDLRYFEKPYVLVPGKKAEKGYVLLRETLRATGKVGIARVVIRTREYLSAVLPQEDALVLILLRYPQELVALDDYRLPSGKAADYRISARETEMAAQLIDSMSGKWDPASYHDEFRERLQAVIQKRIEAQEGTAQVEDDAATPQREDAATNVVDFMSLLQKSLDAKRRTPAKQAEASVPVRKTAKKPARKAAKKAAKPAAKSAAKAKPAKKTTASKMPARRKAG
ncbi:Ku protein [Xanthomonas translucens]|uniref:Non-homologous end joining protein Ku n=1 Tax=Xanthomonas translucens pv. translucens DSM 18974 TaxID=1261556 RepID=A0A1C3THX2_XANCT|nr:Ku protein [Xanthomonas translucens]MCC8447816.1 Ku protein [Xanthomonas translucens pv. translucens]MCT8284127.1 Ku protein [Xanthomonas translucens pv. translucens]MCT8301785.1 Ku protein [Xanthomonas translucens pv. translucens]QSQ30798.1 Ku protein [Xanthomonas translucens pv. translucens]UII64213.1 Ku protein [Xanthomonas translucens]